MPYKSRAQQGFFHSKEGQKKVGKAVVREFDAASKGQHDLPKHVKDKKTEPKKSDKPTKGSDFGMFPQ